MARVLLTVSDPLAHAPRSDGLPPLMVGSFVEVRIEGKPIEDVVRVKRDYLRKNDTVWVNDGGQLRVREVQVVFRDPDYAYIGAGLSEEDRVVTTNLSTVVDGAPLRLEDEA
jgi:multidrug efflux pump subunit AcrA (membrane-fusion protein)